MPARKKQEIITFKVDASLRRALRGIENRSEFIRAALLAALDSVCPLCKGSGILTPDQRRHWEAFARDHALEECKDCHAVHLVCGKPVHDEHDGHEHGKGDGR
jgi:hypothetical protein